jgi:hypothetical protein
MRTCPQHPDRPSRDARHRECRECHALAETRRNRARGVQPQSRDACPQGHPYPESRRPAPATGCAVCHREDQRARYRADPEKGIAAARTWAKANPERRLEYMRAYRDRNREYWRAYFREYSQARRDAGVTKKLKRELRIYQSDPCVYCNGPSREMDHIQPVRYGGSDGWENRAPICRSCNARKRTASLLMFLLRNAA